MVYSFIYFVYSAAVKEKKVNNGKKGKLLIVGKEIELILYLIGVWWKANIGGWGESSIVSKKHKRICKPG